MAAFEGPQLRIPGLTASADLSAKQFYHVKFSGDMTVTVCAAATDIPCGVLQNAPVSGAEAIVCAVGVTKVSSNEALTAGWLIGTSADGQADRKIPGTDTTEYVSGTVVSSSGAAGEIATANINCASPARAA